MFNGARLRWGARFVLSLFLLGSLAMAAWNAWALLGNPLVGLTVERAENEIRARLDAALEAYATPGRMVEHLRTLVAAEPREWPRIDAVLEMAEAREVALPPDMIAGIEAARDEDYAPTRLAAACTACIWDFDACSLSTALACRMPIEISVVGDLTSVARELTHMAQGAPVDEIDLALSAIGIGAVVIAPVVGGSSLSLKMGASLTKTAYRMGSLTPGVVAEGARAANRAIDWDMLARSRPGRLLDDLGKAVRPRAFASIADFLRQVDSLRGSIGSRWTLFVLRKVDSPKDAGKMAAVARAGKGKTPGALEMLGAKRLLRLAVRWSDEVIALGTAVFSAVISLVLLLLSLGKSFALRRLRRWTRDPSAPRRRWLTPRRGAGI